MRYKYSVLGLENNGLDFTKLDQTQQQEQEQEHFTNTYYM